MLKPLAFSLKCGIICNREIVASLFIFLDPAVERALGYLVSLAGIGYQQSVSDGYDNLIFVLRRILFWHDNPPLCVWSYHSILRRIDYE